MLIAVGIILNIIYALFIIKEEKASVKIAYGITGLGLWIYAVTEILSLFGKMSKNTCTAAWILWDIVILVLLLVYIFKHRSKFSINSLKVMLNTNKYELAAIAALIIYAMFIFSLATRIVPYNWDSMSYHLSRIWFWVQNESVRHFATMDTRMLGTPAFTEFVDLHLYLLYGQYNDSILNLTQTASYIFNILLVYGIAKRIGCKFRSRMFAAILFATTPIVFAEGLSTQTDEFAALWILLFTRVLLEMVYSQDKLVLNKSGILRLFVLATSLALSILTKPSGLFCVAVLFLWLLYICVKRKDSLLLIFKWIVSVAILMVIIILPEAARNILTYGAITDPWQGPGQLVLTPDIRYQIVNFFKNIGFFLPGVLWPSFNQIWQHMVYYLGYILRIDVDSILISEGGTYEENLANKIENYEYDTATNSVVTLLFLVILLFIIIKTLIFVIRKIRNRRNNEYTCPVHLGYSTAAFIAFIFTCACVKSEIYVCRYMIASFGLLAPTIGLQIQKIGKKKLLSEGIIYGASGLLICSQFINMVNVHSKHIYSGNERAESYYKVNGGEYESVYKVLNEYLEDNGTTYENIGLIMDSNTYVYPILRLLENFSDNVNYIDVANSSSKYIDNSYSPDCIIIITFGDMGNAYNEGYTYNGYNYIYGRKLSERCLVFVR